MYTAIRRLCIVLSLSTQVFSGGLDNNQIDSKEMMHTQGLDSPKDALCTHYSRHCIRPEKSVKSLNIFGMGHLPKMPNIRIPDVSYLPIILERGDKQIELRGDNARSFLNNLVNTCRQKPKIIRPSICNRTVIW